MINTNISQKSKFFETLLCYGMRIGELASINFRDNPVHRIIESKIYGIDKAEININTEKTCKKREIYIPLDAYKFIINISERLKEIWLKIISLCLEIELNYHLSLQLMY